MPWRYLPADYPPWQTVYGYFATWRDDGTLARLHRELRAQARAAAGREPQPTAAVIDPQSVRAADTVPKATRGWDNAKKVNGRKRQIAVDTTGLVLDMVVTAASVQDRQAARPLLSRVAVLRSLRQRGMQIATGPDAELGEDLAQVPFDGARGQV
jgi:putative transposase